MVTLLYVQYITAGMVFIVCFYFCLHLFIYLVSMYVCVCVYMCTLACVMTHLWGSSDNLSELVLSSTMWAPGINPGCQAWQQAPDDLTSLHFCKLHVVASTELYTELSELCDIYKACMSSTLPASQFHLLLFIAHTIVHTVHSHIHMPMHMISFLP